MANHRGVVLAGVWAAILVAAAPATVLPAHAAVPSGADAFTLPPNGTDLPANSTVIRIQVRPDGDAVWEVQYRVELDEDTRAAFESVRQRVDENPLQYTGPFAEMMKRAAAAGAADTGREMAIRNVSVRARTLPTDVGVVTYRFEWAAFADRSGDRMVVGDAIGGFPLPEQRTLWIQWPAGADVAQVSPSPDTRRDRAVAWRGPVAFAPDEPRVVVTGGAPPPVAPLGVAALAVVLAAVGVVGWRRYRSEPAPDTAADEAVGTDTGAAGASPASETTDEETVPEELLSDAERLLDLVEANGGRMKQQDVVAELEWSETKTSQVVGDLSEEGKLEVYRIGRENVLALPGEMDV